MTRIGKVLSILERRRHRHGGPNAPASWWFRGGFGWSGLWHPSAPGKDSDNDGDTDATDTDDAPAAPSAPAAAPSGGGAPA